MGRVEDNKVIPNADLGRKVTRVRHNRWMGLGADVYKNGVGMVLIKQNRTISCRYIEDFHRPSIAGYVNPLHALIPPGHPVTFAAKPPIATINFVRGGIRRCAVVQW